MSHNSEIFTQDIRGYEQQARQLRAEAILAGVGFVRNWLSNLWHTLGVRSVAASPKV